MCTQTADKYFLFANFGGIPLDVEKRRCINAKIAYRLRDVWKRTRPSKNAFHLQSYVYPMPKK